MARLQCLRLLPSPSETDSGCLQTRALTPDGYASPSGRLSPDDTSCTSHLPGAVDPTIAVPLSSATTAAKLHDEGPHGRGDADGASVDGDVFAAGGRWRGVVRGAANEARGQGQCQDAPPPRHPCQ